MDKLPDALAALAPHLKRLKIDPDKMLTAVYQKLKKHGDVEWKTLDFVCPICESYTILAMVSKPGKNQKKAVTCETCKSSERTVECLDLEKIVHLKHVERRHK
nr:hypothetical protein [Candidatus Sigynarchaeota archaeon]